MDTNSFISKSREIHKNKYDYSLVSYTNNKSKVEIICENHGIFINRADSHLKGSGCLECSREKLSLKYSLSNEEFINKAKNKHESIYDYSNVKYKNLNSKVDILCNIHGIFSQNARNHLNGSGCPKCSHNSRVKNNRSDLLEFIKKSEGIFGVGHYEYNKSVYVNSKTRIIISCKEHGDFQIKPVHHINFKSGCKKCSKSYRRSTEDFINDSKKIHGEKYSYEKTVFKSTDRFVKITCYTHGDFKQKASHHLLGHGCTKCNESKGERIIGSILEQLGIESVREKRFKECRSRKNSLLKFDFYLPKKNICIEYDGIQHFEPLDFFGGIEKLEIQKENDSIKNLFCENKKIKLIRIKHSENILNRIKNEID
jgi:very-short-patch-repair endonuclease